MCVNKNWVRYTCSHHNILNHEKSRNSLTLLKEIINNISIVFKCSHILKYWSCDILSMRKRISSIFYTFPVYLYFFGENLKFLKDIFVWQISKFWGEIGVQNQNNYINMYHHVCFQYGRNIWDEKNKVSHFCFRKSKKKMLKVKNKVFFLFFRCRKK